MALVGEQARVTITIGDQSAGEVMVSLRGGTQAYPARATDPDQAPIQVGKQVYVVDQIGRTLYVTEA